MYVMMMNSNPRFASAEITTTQKNSKLLKRKFKNSDINHTNSTTWKKQKTDLIESNNNNQKEAILFDAFLYDQSWYSNKKSKPYVAPEKSHEEIQVMKSLKDFKCYTRDILEEEMGWGVSTNLELKTNPWDMHKVLKESDCNNLCRLLVGRELVQRHILHLWTRDPQTADKLSNINTKNGALVKVYDMDRGKEYEMTLKRLASTECYVFGMNWMSMFVRERKLKKDDEIGMFWSRFQSRFIFSVVARAPPVA